MEPLRAGVIHSCELAIEIVDSPHSHLPNSAENVQKPSRTTLLPKLPAQFPSRMAFFDILGGLFERRVTGSRRGLAARRSGGFAAVIQKAVSAGFSDIRRRHLSWETLLMQLPTQVPDRNGFSENNRISWSPLGSGWKADADLQLSSVTTVVEPKPRFTE